MAKDFYQILGIERGASDEDIKRAYRKLSKELHPDKHKGDKDAEQKYKEVNEAYETLKDPQKRKMYDQFGSAGPGGAGGQGFGGFDFSGFQGQDFGDIFEGFFGGQGRSRGRTREQGGENIEVQLEVPFTDVVKGVKKKIRIEKFVQCAKCSGSGVAEGSKMVTCNTCNGTGQVVRTAQSFFGTIQQSAMCPECGGNGKVPEEPCKDCQGEGRKMQQADVTVDVPAGIHDGQTLRVRGEGHAGRQGAAAGDLYVHMRVLPSKDFVRDGDDIRSNLSISVLDALLGTQKKIKTVHGDVELKIPDGTQPAQVFRLKGKGLPVLNTSRHGDHFVEVQVDIPKKLSKKEKKLLEEWGKL